MLSQGVEIVVMLFLTSGSSPFIDIMLFMKRSGRRGSRC
jgi:hypothetical protein